MFDEADFKKSLLKPTCKLIDLGKTQNLKGLNENRPKLQLWFETVCDHIPISVRSWTPKLGKKIKYIRYCDNIMGKVWC